jgi:hypothetical protein
VRVCACRHDVNEVGLCFSISFSNCAGSWQKNATFCICEFHRILDESPSGILTSILQGFFTRIVTGSAKSENDGDDTTTSSFYGLRSTAYGRHRNILSSRLTSLLCLLSTERYNIIQMQRIASPFCTRSLKQESLE